VCYDDLCPPLQYEPRKDVFNAAQSGAMITDVVKHELHYLINQVKENKDVDIENDWKVLTLLIGANDLCIACLHIIPYLSPDDYEKHLNETLTEIKKSLPRTFVNLVLMGNLSQIYELSLKSSYCKDVHRLIPIECVCAFTEGKEGERLRKDLDVMAQEYNARTRKVAAWWSEQQYDDFAAIPQPFFSEARADDFPIDFLSSLDCFHPSLLAHQTMAKSLWNNMLTPAAKKRTTFDFTEPFVCPTNTSIFYTN
jgi:phospholipase B1